MLLIAACMEVAMTGYISCLTASTMCVDHDSAKDDALAFRWWNRYTDVIAVEKRLMAVEKVSCSSADSLAEWMSWLMMKERIRCVFVVM